MFTTRQVTNIIKMYSEKSLSIRVIADKYDTYPSKIRRLLIKQGCRLRDKKEAQEIALASNRAKHPTKGQPRSDEVKKKISESSFYNWKKLSEKERKRRIDKAKDRWYNMSDSDRKALQEAASTAVREASRSGSKIERFLYGEISRNGYSVLFHKKGLIANNSLEVDLFLPGLKTVIEIDGPTHFLPIWGEESLRRHIKSDADKTGLLLSNGFIVIRVKYMIKSLSEKYKRDLLRLILDQIEDIEKESHSQQYIELEVEHE